MRSRVATPVVAVGNLTTSLRVDGVGRPVVREVGFDIAPRQTLAAVIA
ncbi:MAG: hypothetical protein ACLFU0_07620 [Alphaproteobacteria bacterium]